ncbi:exodeoxyribonuclease V subunit gamma [Leptonema illini]|uniref:DNA helicase/exodeoxyribonuclease V, gamma subunit n=1 Tax=Leptonema illini DSM 21528 TaxID=929563 RepID=H2CE78_9LEPT|nr:exodeoxyribonuclease V subunit gamma [Leptonema illini]EHQ07633.1 DNA helicase/exodeoxyribonuclease V, gamma subunit [Leptonema illini DSM 21528]
MPGIRIYLSHPLQELADRWIADTSDDLKGADLFHPLRVIVPNRNMKRWLQMYMARKGIVAAHIRFQYVEDGIRSLLEGIAGEYNPQVLRPLDLQGRILHLLLQDLKSDSPLWPLLTQRESHSAREGSGEESLRIFQLSQRMTDLFTNYEYHRVGTLEDWREIDSDLTLDVFADSKFDDSLAADGLFEEQRKLYRAATVEYGKDEQKLNLSVLHADRVPVSEYARRVLKGDVKKGEAPTVYLFGLSLLSRYHISLIRHLSDHYSFRAYLPDLVPGLFKRSANENDEQWSPIEFTAEFRPENDLFAGWKKSFAELLGLLETAFRGRIEWYGRNSDRTYPLGRFHDALLKGSIHPITDRIHIGCCPGERREVETVYQCILQAMRDDPTLELTDIAVLVPDMEHYRPYILDVFERDRTATDRPLIPYNLSDYSAARESHFASGVRALFQLIRGDFTRSEVFELLYNPCCQHAIGIDRETVAEWLRLFDDAGIRRFFDAADRSAQVGTPTDGERSDAFTFLRGLRSLYLGMFLEPDDLLSDGLRPHSLFLVDRTALLKLIDFVQRLYQWQQELKREFTGRERFDKTMEFIDGFLSIPASNNEEQEVRDHMESELRLYDLRLFKDFTLLEQAMLASLTGIAGGRGHYLAGGVTVCSLQPMRPVPFRHIYIAGLGEGQFPPREDRSTLNLLSRDPSVSAGGLPHSNIATGEKARLLLYETLLSATDRIVLLYNGRDTTRDRELLPCSPLNELISYLKKADSPKTEDLVERLPLKLYSRQYTGRNSYLFCNLSRPDIRLLNLSSIRTPPPPSPSLAAGTKVDQPLATDIQIAHLISFLRHPVEAVIKRQMRLYDSRIEDDSLHDDEPFHITDEEIWGMSSLVIERALMLMSEGTSNSAGTAINDAVSSIQGEFADRLPVPPYDEIALKKYRSPDFIELLEMAGPILHSHPFRRIRLADESAVQVNVKGRSIRLTGEIPFLSYADGHATILHVTDRNFTNRVLFPLLFQLLVLERTRSFRWHSFTICIIAIKNGKTQLLQYANNPERTLRSTYIEDLLDEYLAGDLNYLPLRLDLLSKDMWKSDFFDTAVGDAIRRRLEDEALESEVDFMDLLRVIPPKIDDDILSRMRKRWEPIVTLSIPVDDGSSRKGKSTDKTAEKQSRTQSKKQAEKRPAKSSKKQSKKGSKS